MTSPFSTPADEGPWLIRADFTDQAVWDEVVAAAAHDPEGFTDLTASEAFRLVEDRRFDGLTPDGLLALKPYRYSSFLIVDATTITHPDHPLLAVDVSEEQEGAFRIVPAAVQSFVVNMSIANLDFTDFSDNVGPDGIFRWSPAPATPVDPLHAISSLEESEEALASLRDWATTTTEGASMIAHEGVRLARALRGQWPTTVRGALQVAIDAGESDHLAVAKLELARSWAGSDPVHALVAYDAAIVPNIGVSEEGHSDVAAFLTSCDPAELTARLRDALQRDEPGGVGAAIQQLAEMSRYHHPEAARRLAEVVIATGHVDAAPAMHVKLGTWIKDGDPDAGRAHLRAAVESGHPEHASWAAFYIGQELEREDTAAALAAYRVAADHQHPYVAPLALRCSGLLAWKHRDYDAAEESLLDAASYGDAPATRNLADLREQGRTDVTAVGRRPQPRRPVTASIVSNVFVTQRPPEPPDR